MSHEQFRYFSQQQRAAAHASLSTVELEAIYARIAQLDSDIKFLGWFATANAAIMIILFVYALTTVR